MKKQNKRPTALLFIPAYNCAKQLPRVLGQVANSGVSLLHTVLVVDNRSQDNTLDVAVRSANLIPKSLGYAVLENEENYGLGGSHKVAFDYAQRNKFDYLIVFHGDDQANLSDLANHIKKMDKSGLACLLGSRFMFGSRLSGYSRFRTVGNLAFNTLFSFVLLKKISDLGSGLNVYRTSMFADKHYQLFPDGLTFNYMMILAGCHRKQVMEFFPISWREEDQRSNVKLVSQAFELLSMLIKFVIFREDFLKLDHRVVKSYRYIGRSVLTRKPV